jgi:oxazoline/thiazoline dehydrogenase
MNSPFTISLANKIDLIPENERIILKSNTYKLTLSQLQPGLKSAFNHLKHSPATLSDLRQLVVETDGIEGKDKFDKYLQGLTNLGWICHSVFPLAKLTIHKFKIGNNNHSLYLGLPICIK